MRDQQSFGKRRVVVEAAVEERALMGALDAVGLNSAFGVAFAVMAGLVLLNWLAG